MGYFSSGFLVVFGFFEAGVVMGVPYIFAKGYTRKTKVGKISPS
jgi:hypothetical protein